MRTYTRQVGRTRTDKFWIDERTDHVVLSLMPEPASVEAWLNGERMTGLKRTDLDGRALDLGPLRDADTVIVAYEAKRQA